ncbi:MAG: gamma carbonic anhydrase family protein [Solobacterium sp.]|nr:gamma carbonic anhydrase family protein [Solobacterium sp.]
MIRSFNHLYPKLEAGVYLAENASVIGDVHVKKGTSIWYGAVLRGDCGAIEIEENCSIQDNVTIHEATCIERNVTVGHNAVLHGCRIEENCLIGMGAIVMNGVHAGRGSIIAAGALVPNGTIIPPGSLVIGVPARIRGTVSKEQAEHNLSSAAHYQALAAAQLTLIEAQEQ